MNNKQNKKWIIGFVIILACLIAVVALLVVTWINSESYKNSLENRYQDNYMQLIDNVDNIEVGLSKLVATTSFDSQKSIMQDVYTRCVLASENISNIPISMASLSNVNTLINRVGGYVYSLIQNETKVEGENLDSIEALHNSIAIIKYDLNKGYVDGINNKIYLTESNNSDKEGSSFTAGLLSGEESYGDLPSLIYDGPFSESVINKEPKILEEKINEAQAGELVENFAKYWDGYSIKYDGVTNGKLSTYNFVLSSGENVIYLQLLQNGGKLLSAVSYGNYVDTKITENEAIELAQSVAYEFGFEDMVSVWHQVVQDIIYINLAPMVDGVIYYGDLVKVKIDLNGGELIGWEATSYIYNHYERPEYSATLNILEAENLISDSLEVIERNYCVVPNEYVGESDAFEYVCTWSDYTYYIYLDARSGKELKIMRVIKTENGDLLQ